MTRVHVGLGSLRGSLQTYAERWDLLELALDASSPKGARLRAWRKQAGPRLVFSVVLPARVGELAPGPDFDAALEQGLEAARLLEARCVVLRTPPGVRPTSANKKRVALALEGVPRDTVHACWEPRGMWERDEVVALAKSAAIVPVLDGAQERLPEGAAVYTHLRAAGGAVGAPTLARLATELRGRREAFLVVESAAEAKKVRTSLAAALAATPVRKGGVRVIRPAQPLLVAEDEEQ